MTHHPTTLAEGFARLRRDAESRRENCAHLPVAEAMLLALLLHLLAQLERLARTWQAPTLDADEDAAAGLSRSRARIASGRVPPRAQRAERCQDWWLRMNFGRGMRPAAPPPVAPHLRHLARVPPPEPAPT